LIAFFSFLAVYNRRVKKSKEYLKEITIANQFKEDMWNQYNKILNPIRTYTKRYLDFVKQSIKSKYLENSSLVDIKEKLNLNPSKSKG